MNNHNHHQNKNYYIKSGIDGESWEGYVIQLLPIEKLIQVCPTDNTENKREFTKKIFESLKKIGLSLPLVTVETEIKYLKEWHRHTKGADMMDTNTYPETLSRIIAVFGGNTRLSAARQLKYTHIDCIVMNLKEESIEKNIKNIYTLQKLQHKKHKELYSTPTPPIITTNNG